MTIHRNIMIVLLLMAATALLLAAVAGWMSMSMNIPPQVDIP